MAKPTKTEAGVETGLRLLVVGTLLFMAAQAVRKPSAG